MQSTCEVFPYVHVRYVILHRDYRTMQRTCEVSPYVKHVRYVIRQRQYRAMQNTCKVSPYVHVRYVILHGVYRTAQCTCEVSPWSGTTLVQKQGVSVRLYTALKPTPYLGHRIVFVCQLLSTLQTALWTQCQVSHYVSYH